MSYTIKHIVRIINGSFLAEEADAVIDTLVYDSRRASQSGGALFFAILTGHNDGHRFIGGAYQRGVRNFVVSAPVDVEALPGSNVILVTNTLDALQQLAAFHRMQFSIPVIGIAGSNGKTIVKEWLNLMLQDDQKIIRSPRSYNSQLGVPLSVWMMGPEHSLAIFEAGISAPGEMEKLEQVIRPTIGILTNIGDAHNDGFGNDLAFKCAEKERLFDDCETVIGPLSDLEKGGAAWDRIREKSLTWGEEPGNTFQVTAIKKEGHTAIISLLYQSEAIVFTTPFTDDASIENTITCCCVLLHLGYGPAVVQGRIGRLHAIDMRLQLKHGNNGCLVINDSYSADITSLNMALQFLSQQAPGLKRTVILSDFLETGKSDEALFAEIGSLLDRHGIDRVIGIGEHIAHHLPKGERALQFYPDTDSFIHHFRASDFFNEIILVKGARRFEFERIARQFERRQHQTMLEINLNALVHNLKEYGRMLRPGTKVMAMVKAFSYGSGGAEIASVLQYHNVHYLGVAYADEGVELRKAGITIPIMVMNAEEASFFSLTEYNLEPVIYSFALLQQFESYLEGQALASFPVHIEVETGMNRLGFAPSDMETLAVHLSKRQLLRVQSLFSHLAASEDPDQDAFTAQQAALFIEAAAVLAAHLPYPFIRHLSNSAAIIRHPSLQLDMVRLGIGLYGVEVDDKELLDLQAVASLRSTVSQVKEVAKGESVSYNRRGVVSRDSRIATVRIGYADGYSRRFSNGAGRMLIRGRLAPVIGTVCMDMTMVDVTDIPGVLEGDEVLIFGPKLPVQEVASSIGTIPYEIMTGVSQRVKRVYFHE